MPAGDISPVRNKEIRLSLTAGHNRPAAFIDHEKIEAWSLGKERTWTSNRVFHLRDSGSSLQRNRHPPRRRGSSLHSHRTNNSRRRPRSHRPRRQRISSRRHHRLCRPSSQRRSTHLGRCSRRCRASPSRASIRLKPHTLRAIPCRGSRHPHSSPLRHPSRDSNTISSRHTGRRPRARLRPPGGCLEVGKWCWAFS